ncbi:LuxR C-terminal-related transcriptional regulator [Nonomuraea sp. NPDC050663]
MIRHGLAMTLTTEHDIEVVGEASDGLEAVEMADRLLPDVVLMDVRMPRRSGIEATRGIKSSVPSTRIIMLTVSDEEEDLFEAIKAGATGYLLKDVQLDEVPDAVRGVHEGQSLINPAMAAKLINEFASMSRKEAERPPQLPVPRLTEREMEVLRLVAKGMNNREIAKQLFISENTVKNHVRNILDKLQLHSRMEAVVYAVRERMLEIT